MKELLKTVKNAVNEEYLRAAEKHGATHNSRHESYSVILEEFEESKDEIVKLDRALSLFWETTKRNSYKGTALAALAEMEKNAIEAAAELVQVAAMCRKAQFTERKI